MTLGEGFFLFLPCYLMSEDDLSFCHSATYTGRSNESNFCYSERLIYDVDDNTGSL